MRKLFTNKVFLAIVAIVPIIMLLVSTSSPHGSLNFVRNLLSVPLTPLRQAYSFVTNGVGGVIEDFSNLRSALEENQAMRLEIREIEALKIEMEQLERQNQEFRSLLNFKTQYADYGFLGGTIIGKAPGNWFDVFTINRGVKDGLVQGESYTVISSEGLVGRVSNVNLLSSEVVSIIDMDSTVSVRVARTRDLFVVRGDIALKQQGRVRVDYIPPNSDLVPGDVLETSGLGSIYPKGIRVGTIEKIVKNLGQFDSHAILRPAVDFKRLEEIVVLVPAGSGETE